MIPAKFICRPSTHHHQHGQQITSEVVNDLAYDSITVLTV